MMKFFQRLGKALMLPVACLPVCGILMGIGYILAPAAMAGEVQGFTAGGFSYSIGLFLIKAGGALIDNIPGCLLLAWQLVWPRMAMAQPVLLVWYPCL